MSNMAVIGRSVKLSNDVKTSFTDFKDVVQQISTTNLTVESSTEQLKNASIMIKESTEQTHSLVNMNASAIEQAKTNSIEISLGRQATSCIKLI